MTPRTRRFTCRRAAVAVLGGLLCLSAQATEPRAGAWTDLEDALRYDGTAVLRAASAALLLSGQTGGRLPLEILAVPESSGEPERSVTVHVEIDARPLLAREDPLPPQLDTVIYALDQEGQIVETSANSLRLDRPGWREKVASRPLSQISSLDLPRGDYVLRILVRDATSPLFGIASREIAVASGDSGLAPHWALEAYGARLLVVPEHQMSIATYPVVVDRAIYIPAARPVWIPGSTVLVAGGPPADVSEAEGLQLTSTDGTATAALAIISASDASRPDGTFARVLQLRVPQIPSGPYYLEGGAIGGGRQLVTLSRAPSSKDGALSWIHLSDDERSILATHPGGDEHDLRDSPTSIDMASLVEDYDSVVEALERGNGDRATEVLRSQEARAAEAGHQALTWLEKVQMSRISRLDPTQSQLLLRLFLLHLDRLEDYRATGNSRLAEHSVRIGVRIAADLGHAARDPESRQTAAAATALLGETLRQSGRMRRSETLFRQSLELDPRLTVALVGLAAAYEQTGRYGKATEMLSRLAEIEPNEPETQLRLAINLKRTGRSEEAASRLQQLIAGDAPDWVGLVAAHEAARIALEADEVDAALRQLRVAEERRQEDQTTAVLLAYLLDRQGSAQQAGRRIERLVRAAPYRVQSSRQRYTLTPPADLREIRRALEEYAGLESGTETDAAMERDNDP